MVTVPEKILELLQREDRILIAAHTNPDGDAVGACAALGWMLRLMDKNVLLYNSTGFPDYLSWLRLPGPVITKVEDLPCPPALIVALDCGDAARLGDDLQPLLATTPVINIDHHLGNPEFGSAANWVDPTMSATGEMVGHVVEAMHLPLHGALGEALYVALVSDTGSFGYGNTTPECMRLASRLLDSGLNVADVRSKLDNTWSESRMRLWGLLMRDARITENGKLGSVIITKDMLEKMGASKDDTEGFVEQMRRVKGVRVSLLLREVESNGKPATKISLRSSGPDDVRAVAVQFGGGGHKNAAGATLDLEPEKAINVVLPYVRHVWNKVRL